MQFSNIFYLFTYLAFVKAAPTPLQCRSGVAGCVIPPSGLIVFHGAAGAQYSLTVPLDGKPVATSLSPLGTSYSIF